MNGILKIFGRSLWSMCLVLLVLLGVEGIRLAVNTTLVANGAMNQIEVSHGNIVMALLVVMPILVPLVVFRKAKRENISSSAYYVGAILSYVVAAAAMSVLNIAWYQVEQTMLSKQIQYLNFIDVFGWSQFDNFGMFMYHGAAFLLLMACLHLLFSVHGKLGFSIWFAAIASLSVGLSVGMLREKIANGLTYLLYNDSWMEVSIMMAIAAGVLAAVSYLFIVTKNMKKTPAEGNPAESNNRPDGAQANGFGGPAQSFGFGEMKARDGAFVPSGAAAGAGFAAGAGVGAVGAATATGAHRKTDYSWDVADYKEELESIKSFEPAEMDFSSEPNNSSSGSPKVSYSSSYGSSNSSSSVKYPDPPVYPPEPRIPDERES
ncbi:hypothetical protein [Paenibacillus agilis]|uniref:hypothetical protein n=1 Tax=Paenibacillus agilis TaxID=3020863 RepID=UPI001649C94C|nr:hypothetical protein [Paenibacillus agilis]